METVKIIFRYFKRTRDQEITYSGLNQKNPFMKGYPDSD